MNITNIKEMLAGTLNLEPPWKIEGAEFDTEHKQLHIHVGIDENAVLLCPHCGGSAKRYGYEPRERLWRHADCFFYECFVHCRRPRVICPNCGVQQLNAPFERKSSRFTLMFEGYAMMLLPDLPRARAAKVLRCNEKTLEAIMHYWIGRADEARSLASVARLAIDETSFRRGHDYVTIAIDADKKCVIDVEHGKDKAAVASIATKLSRQGGNTESIKAVTSDMSKAFVPAIAECFPQACHVIDKFHVKQMVIKAMEETRKTEQRNCKAKKELFLGRKLFMIPSSTMTQEQASQVLKLSKSYPQTGRAFRIVTALDSFYALWNEDEAGTAFDKLYSWMRRCHLPEMKKVATSIKEHKPKILAYFTQRITNAISEGINSLIQTAKRKAKGYRTYRGFEAMIYLIAGKLELAVPSPF